MGTHTRVLSERSELMVFAYEARPCSLRKSGREAAGGASRCLCLNTSPSRPRASSLRTSESPSTSKPRSFSGLCSQRVKSNNRRLLKASALSADGASKYKDLLDFDTFEWNGFRVNHAISKAKRGEEALDVVLVHGFGASIGHWKKNIVELVRAGHSVHAIDLLGFGASEKPLDYDYTMEGWRDLLVTYLREKILATGQGKVVIIGNSIGSLASLLTAQELVTSKGGLEKDQLKGVVLMNCAGGMNNAATLDDDWRVKLAYPIFALINALLKVKPVAEFLFNKFRNKETIESVLSQVYGNQDSVDEELVDLIHGPSCTPGALEAFVSILTGPPGPRPERLMPELLQAQVPLLVLWGDEDPFTPMDGPVAKYFLDKLSAEYDFVTKQVLPATGHCPHDDRPEQVHKHLLPWLAAL